MFVWKNSGSTFISICEAPIKPQKCGREKLWLSPKHCSRRCNSGRLKGRCYLAKEDEPFTLRFQPSMTKTSLEQVEKWRRLPREGETIEFKRAGEGFKDGDLMRYCVALSNAGGGTLILGMDDKPLPRPVHGTNAYPNPGILAKKIWDTLRFRVEVEEFLHPDGRLLLFHISPCPLGEVRSYNAACWWRVDENLVAMPPEEIHRRLSVVAPGWSQGIARQRCDGAEVARLLGVQTYYDLRERTFPAGRSEVLNEFEKQGFVVKDHAGYNITNMGAILLAKRLSDFPHLARKAVRVVVYEGKNKLNARLDTATMEPNPFDAGYAVSFKQLFEFVKAQVPRRQVIEGALRRDIALVPDITLRELLPNALVHQDLSETGNSVVVEVYADRVEVISPGRPIIPVERFITENKSRNQALASAMRLMRICEEQGQGMQKTILAIEGQHLPAPNFRVGETRTTVVVYGPKTFAQMEKSERVRACFQHCCLKWITNEKMTNQTLRERFGLPQNQAKTAAMSQLIAETIAAELIKPVETESGSKRYASYVPIWG